VSEFAEVPAVQAWIAFCSKAVVFHKAEAAKYFEQHDHSVSNYHASVAEWYQNAAGEAWARLGMLAAMGE